MDSNTSMLTMVDYKKLKFPFHGGSAFTSELNVVIVFLLSFSFHSFVVWLGSAASTEKNRYNKKNPSDLFHMLFVFILAHGYMVELKQLL